MNLLRYSGFCAKLIYKDVTIYLDPSIDKFVFHSMGEIKTYSTVTECRENIDFCIDQSPIRNRLYNRELKLLEELYSVKNQIAILD